MSTKIVLDASVALAWFLPGHTEAQRTYANAVLDHIRNDAGRQAFFVIPDHMRSSSCFCPLLLSAILADVSSRSVPALHADMVSKDTVVNHVPRVGQRVPAHAWHCGGRTDTRHGLNQ